VNMLSRQFSVRCVLSYIIAQCVSLLYCELVSNFSRRCELIVSAQLLSTGRKNEQRF